MKLRRCLTAVLTLVAWPIIASADLAGTCRPIQLDGDLADWSAADVLYSDDGIRAANGNPDGSPLKSTYTNIYVANDAHYLYVAMHCKDTSGASITNMYYRQLFIDSDMNTNSGYLSTDWMQQGGYDYMVVYGVGGSSIIYAYTNTGDRTLWTWVDPATAPCYVDYASSDSVIELRVRRTLLRMTGDQARLQFRVTGGDIPTSDDDTLAAHPENAVETYAFAPGFFGSFKTVRPDGNLDAEWEESDILYEDSEISEGLPTQSVYETIYAANDEVFLYVGVRCKGSGGAAWSNAWRRDVYLDTDMDAGTGFNGGWMDGGGYDRRFSWGQNWAYTLYRWDTGTASFVDLAYYPESATWFGTNAIEWRLPRSMLGATGDQVRIQVHVADAVAETWAHADDTYVKEYTFAPGLRGVHKTSALDGDLGEWKANEAFYADFEIGTSPGQDDGNPLNSSYSNIFVANDDDYLYVALDCKGTDGGPITQNWARGFFIDSDMNPDTGYDAGSMAGGYDRWVKYGSRGDWDTHDFGIYRFTGEVDQVGWHFDLIAGADIAYSNGSSTIEWRINRAHLGMTGCQARLAFKVSEYAVGWDVTNVTWAPAQEQYVKTYTFVPDFDLAGLVLGTAGERLTWGATLNHRYTLQYSHDLVQDSWTDVLPTNIAGPALPPFELTVTNPPAASGRRFYRVVGSE